MPNNNEQLQKEALNKIKRINRRLKIYDDLDLKGFAFKEILNELYEEDYSIYTKSKNLSVSKKNLSLYSEPRLKAFIVNLDKILSNDNFMNKGKFIAHVEEKKKQIAEMDDYRTDAFDNTMRLTYGEEYEHLLKYIYKGDKKKLYKDFLTLKEGEMTDLSYDSENVMNYMKKQYEIDIKRSIEEEATRRTEKHFGLMSDEDIKEKRNRLNKIRGRNKRS